MGNTWTAGSVEVSGTAGGSVSGDVTVASTAGAEVVRLTQRSHWTRRLEPSTCHLMTRSRALPLVSIDGANFDVLSSGGGVSSFIDGQRRCLSPAALCSTKQTNPHATLTAARGCPLIQSPCRASRRFSFRLWNPLVLMPPRSALCLAEHNHRRSFA